MPDPNQGSSEVTDALNRPSLAMQQLQSSCAASQRTNRLTRMVMVLQPGYECTDDSPAGSRHRDEGHELPHVRHVPEHGLDHGRGRTHDALELVTVVPVPQQLHCPAAATDQPGKPFIIRHRLLTGQHPYLLDTE